MNKNATSLSVSSIHPKLFAGSPSFLGGLSNERELVPLIPDEFRRHENPWLQLANSIFFNGASMKQWSFRSDDAAVVRRQLDCFKAALQGFDLSHQDKEALCGWMLSEILEEVP